MWQNQQACITVVVPGNCKTFINEINLYKKSHLKKSDLNGRNNVLRNKYINVWLRIEVGI